MIFTEQAVKGVGYSSEKRGDRRCAHRCSNPMASALLIAGGRIFSDRRRLLGWEAAALGRPRWPWQRQCCTSTCCSHVKSRPDSRSLCRAVRTPAANRCEDLHAPARFPLPRMEVVFGYAAAPGLVAATDGKLFYHSDEEQEPVPSYEPLAPLVKGCGSLAAFESHSSSRAQRRTGGDAVASRDDPVLRRYVHEHHGPR